MKKMYLGFLPAVLFIYTLNDQMREVASEGKLSLKFLRYENPNKFKYNLKCCDGEYRRGACTGGCDHKVRVCIDHQNSTEDVETCPLGRYELGGVAFDEESFDFPSVFLGGLPNPFPISLENWPGGVQIKIMVYDQDTGANELIDDFRLEFTQPTPAVGWSSSQADYDTTMDLEGLRPIVPSRLSIAIEAYCDANFYGSNCAINCVPENDCMGHYECNRTTGEKICLRGWTGENCATKIPGVAECSPDQNCNSGTCVRESSNSSLFYCCCDAGYTGDYCLEDVDECAVNPCENGGECLQPQPNSFECKCPLLYTGQTCERRKTCEDNPCQNNGLCFPLFEDIFQCACLEGFTGEFCESSNTPPTRSSPTTAQETTPSTTSSTTLKPLPFCAPDFYGPMCSVYCKADETCNAGYYTCDVRTGAKICSEGWMGSDCNIRNSSYIPDAECPESFCRNGAFCKNNTCCCAPGFTGRLCHIEILECDSNPCINGGKCKDRIGNYFCECTSGYAGRNCEILEIDPARTTTTAPVNPCDSLTCDNGGICLVDEKAGAVCLCPRGYHGSSCQNATNPVTNTVCPENRYGPECDVVCFPWNSCREGHYDCHYSTGDRICLAGWTGISCKTRFLSQNTDPECPENECRNGGQCFNGSCCCPRGFEGDYCEKEVFECRSGPCVNGGHCIELVNGFECDCLEGYTGDLCEVNQTAAVSTSTASPVSVQTTLSNPCSSQPCLNSGACIQRQRGFECICVEGFAGILCEDSGTTLAMPFITTGTPVPDESTPALRCGLRPCQNSGTCVDLANGFQCNCPTGFTGYRCESVESTTLSTSLITDETTAIRTCSLQPCKNNADCIQLQDDFKCECPIGFTGRLCETNQTTTLVTSPPTTLPSSTPFDACIHAPCQNDAVCIPFTNGFSCSCQQGYTGILCETMISTVETTTPATTLKTNPVPRCDFSPCQNEGVCIEINNGYECDCLPGYTGALCESTLTITDSSTKVSNIETTPSSKTVTNAESYSPTIESNTTHYLAGTTPGSGDMSNFTTGAESQMSTKSTTSTSTSDKDLSSVSGDSTSISAGTTTETSTETTSTTTLTTMVTTPPPTYFVNSFYVLKWWNFLNEDQIVDVLRYATYLTNLRTGIQQSSIAVTSLEKWDALDQRGRNIAELLYNASLANGFKGPLRRPTATAIQEALKNRGYNIRLYQGPRPWRYIYHYDLYYKAKRTDTLRKIISRLDEAWKIKYTEYSNCKCTFSIRIPRRVRYLDRNGSIITRYIYFVLVDGVLNDPAVKPGPSLSELSRYFKTEEGDSAVVNSGNLTEYDSHHIIHITGNGSRINNEILEDVLIEALKNTTGTKNCTNLEVNIARRESQIDHNGKQVTKVMYTAECDSTSIDIQTNNSDIWNAVDEVLNDRGESGISVYREDLRLFDWGDAYTAYFNGDLSADAGQAILEAWKQGSEDIKDCKCNVTIYVIPRRRYVGIYGLQTTGVTYFITKENEFLKPEVSTAPNGEIFQKAARENDIFNTVYRRKEIRQYDYHYSFLLKGTLKKKDQVSLEKQIETVWKSTIPAGNLPPCSKCSLSVTVAKPEVYYSSTGERLTNVVYFINWGGNVLNPRYTTPPTENDLIRNKIDVCDCEGIRSKHIDIDSSLSYSQAKEVQQKIQTAWKRRFGGAVVMFKRTNEFVDVKGYSVTRLHYTVSNNNIDITEPIFQFPVTNSVTSQLSPWKPSVIPTHRVYSFFKWGSPTQNKEGLTAAIKKAWLATNTEVAVDVLDVKILSQEGDYTSDDNTATVTKVRYTVSVLNADSSIANVEEPSVEVYESAFKGSGFGVCDCIPRKIRELYITGTVDDTDTDKLQEAITKAWRKENPDFSGTLTTNVVNKTNGYQSSDENGTKLTKVTYTVTPDVNRSDVYSTDLSQPNNSELNDELQVVYPELTTYDGDVIKEKVETRPQWIIPVVIVICLLILVIIIVVIVLVIRNRKNRKSRTLKRSPNEIRGFDKEHFSTEPDFDNPAYDASEVSQKPDTHYMNMSQ